jgi:hypothetical protein
VSLPGWPRSWRAAPRVFVCALDSERPIGKIKEQYAIDGDGHPVTVEGKFAGGKRTVFVPVARLKDEDGVLRVPYSTNHVGETPEVDGRDGVSAECGRRLRDHYGIDGGDQEMRSDNHSYATLVPDDEGMAKPVADPSRLEMPSADKRTKETTSRLREPGSAEIRHITADDVTPSESRAP